MAKLKEGDVIEVFGYVMLKKLEPGKYRILSVKEEYGRPVYSIARPRGKKCLARFYCEQIDGWLKSAADENLNKIVKVG